MSTAGVFLKTLNKPRSGTDVQPIRAFPKDRTNSPIYIVWEEAYLRTRKRHWSCTILAAQQKYDRTYANLGQFGQDVSRRQA